MSEYHRFKLLPSVQLVSAHDEQRCFAIAADVVNTVNAHVFRGFPPRSVQVRGVSLTPRDTADGSVRWLARVELAASLDDAALFAVVDGDNVKQVQMWRVVHWPEWIQ